MVMFTDYLLGRLDKREVSAIAAHEIAHIQRKRLKAVINFARFFKVLLFNQALVVSACIIFSLPSIWFISVVDLLTVVYSFMPFWFYREQGDVPRIESHSLVVQEDLQSGD